MDRSFRQSQASSTRAQLWMLKVPSPKYSPGLHRQQQHKVETSLQWQEYFSQFQDTTDALPSYIHPPKKNTSHGNEVLPHFTKHLIQRLYYQRRSPCQDPAGKWTTQRPPDHRKETQTAVVWICLPFVRPGQNHIARHSERGKKTRQTKEEMRGQH